MKNACHSTANYIFSSYSSLLYSLNDGKRKSDLDDVYLVYRRHEAEHLEDVEDLGDVEDDGGGQHRQQVRHHHAAMFNVYTPCWLMIRVPPC